MFVLHLAQIFFNEVFQTIFNEYLLYLEEFSASPILCQFAILYKNKTKQNKTKQNKTKQNKTKQNKTKQNKNKTKQKNPFNFWFMSKWRMNSWHKVIIFVCLYAKHFLLHLLKYEKIDDKQNRQTSICFGALYWLTFDIWLFT